MYIGIDVGGTNIATAVVNQSGGILYNSTISTNAQRGYVDVIKDIGKIILDIKKNFPNILGIGIGVPGVVSSDLEVVTYCPNLNWHERNISRDLKNIFDDITEPIFVDNDANLAALAELEVGSLQGLDNGVMITLGTGIGGGIIINNSILRGHHGLGSEVGHIIIGDNFYDCNCGNTGCFETFASATAVIKYTKKLLESNQYVGTRGHRILTKKLSNNVLEAKDVMDLAKQQDALAMDVFYRLVKYLAIGLINIIHIFDPKKIALGGGLSYTGEFLLSALRDEIAKRHFIRGFPFADIVIASLGNDAGVIGAAMLAKIELE